VRVLVVEDDAALADVIARGLREGALAVDLALDGEDALRKTAITIYDVVVLDRDLPRVHGDDVCRELAESGRGERILMLTASGTLDDRVAGLSLGADDYLPKPFAMRELVARVRALGRRTPSSVPPVLRCGDLEIDTAAPGHQSGPRITLTRKSSASSRCSPWPRARS
jgi:DNA-binding response OmpR family regulator